ncbi:dTDP-4-dehydrorhamnose 3,5-epimerase [Thermosynechococcus sp. PP45]|uniref:dTDP-4-dehydrorhamnose 3,5-epimerase n=1 Tax=unclassified Thermosynechococcus TaxID=2622553 RepID=UPI002672AD24|nr:MULTISPECIES: dTDP-4-dehydrorhamnose 3,5-epimerase [unclassified Thermosynechococcus]WKT80099.1 dTDP-4-dehydrorhamnose 3,5-epimerase [Thermosynechococcus sp. PP45]WNC23709.1 dTDP-4-dehydrorhamnose 3,5-epimerase [Thermosynechococcus sp. PP551]WNC26285.1 dTDP-4-dehydrorhamnose 3,5-epimerase [Thermosynechococcus sp. PP555]
MKRFSFTPLPLADLVLIERHPVEDARGYFERLFCCTELAEVLNGKPIAQINHSYTAHRGVVRGLHFQYPPHAETKFVSCLRGEVFDVAVDLRHGSPTFLAWHGELLSAANRKTLAIPEGFAHGFQTLSDECELLYFHTAPYQPTAEGGLHPQDPCLGIAWPLPVAQLSPRDAAHPFVDDCFAGITL